MVRKRNAVIGIFCGLVGLLGVTPIAYADTPLTHADIQQIRNQVDFIPDGGSARLAQLSDRLDPGDALSTQQASFAELEFNDGSLARVGELVLFRFQPDTRTFELDNGTLLLLIPPGQGTSRLRTPNASAGIRGSGLFVRYIEGETPAQSVTLVGALTTSGITVSNTVEELVWGSEENSFTHTDESTSDVTTVELEAGHMAVILGDEPPQVFSFDIDVFYQTSTLVSGLDLDGDGDPSVPIWREEFNDGEHLLSVPGASGEGENDAIALVREETTDGLLAQSGTLTTPYIDNPPFVYGGNWQPNTVWLPTGPQSGPNHTETIDNIIDSADIQTPQSSLGTGPDNGRTPISPVDPPGVVGPSPIVGPRPGRIVDIPAPFVGPEPGQGVNGPAPLVGPIPRAQPPVSPSPPPVTPTPTPPVIPSPPPTTPEPPGPGTTPPSPPDPTPNPTPTPNPVEPPTQPDPEPIPIPTPDPTPPIREIPINPTPEPNRAADPGNNPGPDMGPVDDPPSAPINEPTVPNNPNMDNDPSPQPIFEPPPGNDGPDMDDIDSGGDDPDLLIPDIIVGPNPG